MTQPNFDYSTVVVPFGKYSRQTIEDIPSPYLRWLRDEFKVKKPDDRTIQLAAKLELQYRDRHDAHFDSSMAYTREEEDEEDDTNGVMTLDYAMRLPL